MNKIDIHLNYGEIYFTVGETFLTCYENMTEEDFEIKEENDTLSIRDKRKGTRRPFGKKSNYTPIIRIVVPIQHSFEKISLLVGASEVHAESLTTNALTLKMGAGEFDVKKLNVSDYATIESGAGEVHVHSGCIHNLDISSGAGEIHIQATLTGNSYINTGVGEILLKLIGTPNDYSATVSKSIGHLCVNGFSSCNGMTYGSGPNHIIVNGGIGEIEITV